MKGVQLHLYTYENRRAHGELVYEWLLEHAKRLGIPGGSAFRAIAGFGRHGKLHEETFFELAGEVPILIEFLVSESDCSRLLDSLAAEELDLFYTQMPVEFGELNGLQEK